MRVVSIVVLAATFAWPAGGKPLITSSEETFARACLAREASPDRLASVCREALAEFGLTQSQRVDLMIALGDAHLWADDFEKSVTAYRDATRLDQRSTDAWNGLGWALWERDGDQAAYDAFQTSLSISVSVQGLGGTAATGRRTGDVSNDQAREMLGAALAIDPDYIWAVREIGWTFLDDNRPDEALQQFQSALEIEPKDVNARYGIGRAELALGQAEAALITFNDVLLDSPTDYATQVYRVIALRRLDRNAQALRDADRLIEAYPEKSSGYVERGHALMALERRREAIETYEAASIALGPNNTVLYWHADALITDNRFEDALAVIERGLELPGADYSDHLLKAYIALELGDYGMARDAAEASIATGVEDPWAHYYIAITLVRDGKVSAGLDRFEVALAGGLPSDRISDFALELVEAGKYVEAAQLRLKY